MAAPDRRFTVLLFKAVLPQREGSVPPLRPAAHIMAKTAKKPPAFRVSSSAARSTRVVPQAGTRAARSAPARKPRGLTSAAKTGPAALGSLAPAERRAIEQVLTGDSTLLHGVFRAREAELFVALAAASSRPVVATSPYTSELIDQARAQRSVDVVTLAPENGARALNELRRRLERGGPLLLVVEPGRLFDGQLTALLAKSPIGALAIGRAHAASVSAHELCPGYLYLHKIVRSLQVPLLCTATSSGEAIVADIAGAARISARRVLAAGEPLVQRSATFLRKADRLAALAAAVSRAASPAVAVTVTPQDADQLFAQLTSMGVAAFRSHTAMSEAERDQSLAAFCKGPTGAVLITQSPHESSSGLAGDTHRGVGARAPRPDIGLLVHFQAPLSVEQYFEDCAWLASGGVSQLLMDSSDAALSQTVLAQQRVKPLAVESVARVLAQGGSAAPHNPESREAPRGLQLDVLALRAGTSRRSVERVLGALRSRGLLWRDSGLITALATGEELLREAAVIASAFSSVRGRDASRIGAVLTYAERLQDLRGAGAEAALPASSAAS